MKETSGKRARQIRSDLKLTQSAIAELLDISISSWQKYEQGDQEIGTKTLKALEKQGYNTQWILSGKGPMKGHFTKEDSNFSKPRQQNESKTAKTIFLDIMKEIKNQLPEKQLSGSDSIFEEAIEEAFFIAQTSKTPKEIKSAKELTIKRILFKHS